MQKQQRGQQAVPEAAAAAVGSMAADPWLGLRLGGAEQLRVRLLVVAGRWMRRGGTR